jgi:hypothetical protein
MDGRSGIKLSHSYLLGGAVHFEGICDNGASARGNGYVELTGYAGNLLLR